MSSVQELLTEKNVGQISDTYQLKSAENTSQLLEDLSSDQLAEMVDELQNTQLTSLSQGTQNWQAVEGISEILNNRWQKELDAYGMDAIAKTTVTKDLLIEFIKDRMMTYNVLLNAPKDAIIDKEAATVSVEMAQADAKYKMEKLPNFLKVVESEGTNENAYEYWVLYWNDILEEELPPWYCT